MTCVIKKTVGLVQQLLGKVGSMRRRTTNLPAKSTYIFKIHFLTKCYSIPSDDEVDEMVGVAFSLMFAINPDGLLIVLESKLGLCSKGVSEARKQERLHL